MSASETYIQLELKLNKLGRIPLSKGYKHLLESYAKVVIDYPEVIEECRGVRVYCSKWLHKIYGDYFAVLWIHYIIMEMTAIDAYLTKHNLEPVNVQLSKENDNGKIDYSNERSNQQML